MSARIGPRKSAMREHADAPVELERVGTVPMDGIAVQVGGQVDDGDRFKGAFLASHCMRATWTRRRANNEHTLTQIPHPMQSSSEMKAILSVGETSMQSLPMRTTGQVRLHSWRHFFGRQRSSLTIAMRVSDDFSSAAAALSDMAVEEGG